MKPVSGREVFCMINSQSRIPMDESELHRSSLRTTCRKGNYQMFPIGRGEDLFVVSVSALSGQLFDGPFANRAGKIGVTQVSAGPQR